MPACSANCVALGPVYAAEVAGIARHQLQVKVSLAEGRLRRAGSGGKGKEVVNWYAQVRVAN